MVGNASQGSVFVEWLKDRASNCLLGQWADKILDVLAIKGQAKEGRLLAKFCVVWPSFSLMKPFRNG